MIPIKNQEEIKIMVEGGKILAEIMKYLKKMIRPGITTKELDRVAYDLVLKYKAKPSFLGHEGYPATLCTSINEEIVHALPSDRILKEGDIISLDLGIQWKEFHTDMAVTLGIARISKKAKKLIKTTKKALEAGIKEIKAGKHVGDISFTIQNFVEKQGFNVVRDLCGHGIGREIHEEPQVLNYGKRGTGPELQEGMVFCLEPMVVAGDWKIKKSKDGYGFQTADGSLSCHFEHTILVTRHGHRILTFSE